MPEINSNDLHDNIFLIFSSSILKSCGLKNEAVIYSLLRKIDLDNSNLSYLYSNNLYNQKNIVDMGISIFFGKEIDSGKSTFEYKNICKYKELFLQSARSLNLTRTNVISDNKLEAGLSVLSSLYLTTFYHPIPFFLPFSSCYCGRYDFWDKIDYITLRSKVGNFAFSEKLMGEITSSEFWNVKTEMDVFPLAVRERLLRNREMDKEYNPAAMMKAMIIRIGELSNVDYGVLDRSIRSFLRYVEHVDYVRPDRELEYLKIIESRLETSIRNCVNSFL